MKHHKIAIIGSGAVGSTIAYTLIMRNVVAEILLVDKDKNKCKGEERDLTNALPFTQTSTVRQATLKEAGNKADIIIIAAGRRQKPKEPRIDLLKDNKKIICSIIKQMKPLNKEALIIMVANPVDLLTHIAWKESRLPSKQVMGSGTMLDTHRLRNMLSGTLKIAEQSLHIYVLGEHGEDQFVAWSSATVGGVPLTSFAKLSPKAQLKLEKDVRNEAYKIIEYKGATFFGVAACVAAMCENIVFNTRRIIPVSSYTTKYKSTLSLPAVIGSQGIEKIIDIPLNTHEQAKLKKAAKKLSKLYDTACR